MFTSNLYKNLSHNSANTADTICTSGDPKVRPLMCVTHQERQGRSQRPIRRFSPDPNGGRK